MLFSTCKCVIQTGNTAKRAQHPVVHLSVNKFGQRLAIAINLISFRQGGFNLTRSDSIFYLPCNAHQAILPIKL